MNRFCDYRRHHRAKTVNVQQTALRELLQDALKLPEPVRVKSALTALNKLE